MEFLVEVLFSAIVQSKMVREMTETGESVFRCLDCDHRSKRSSDLAKHIDAKERFHLILNPEWFGDHEIWLFFLSLRRVRSYGVHKDIRN